MVKNIFKDTVISLGTSYLISIIYVLLLMGILMIISALNALLYFLGEIVVSAVFFIVMFLLLCGAMYVNHHISYDYAYKKTFAGKFNEKEQNISLVVALIVQTSLLFLTLGNSSWGSTIAFASSFYSIPFCRIATLILGTEHMGKFAGSIVGTIVFYIIRYLSMFKSYRYVVSRSELLLLEKKKAAIANFFSE